MKLCLMILVMGCMSLIVSSLSDDNPPAKRNIDYALPNQRGQSRRISSGSVTNLSPRTPFQAHFYDRSNGRHQTRVPSRRNRPQSLPAPPYAVQMEPLVQYSQRDPLYHQKLDGDNVTKDSNNEDKKHSRIDNEPEGSNIDEVSNQYGVPGVYDSQLQYDTSLYPHYYKEPEPIIEIIIKESNESLPAPPSPHPTQSTRPTKEPVEVFYVKYKKNPVSNGKSGEEDVVYEHPIPAITPPSNVEHEPITEPPYESTPPPPPPPTTTLRTIIRPDSEIYHGSGLRVTFGEPEIKNADPALEEQSAPEPSIALPTSHFIAQKRDSTVINTQSQFKRQPGPYQPLSQEQLQHQNNFQNPSQPLSTPLSSLQPGTYQTPPPQFQQPSQYQKQQAFARQAQPPPPVFRPQHTSAIFPQQVRPQQQLHQHHQQYQQQFNQRQPIQQVNQGQQTRQSNQFATLQQPAQIPQQRPTFRPQQNQQQFEQPKNFFPNQQQQYQQIHRQPNLQQYRSQPIHVQPQPDINNQFNRQLQQQQKSQHLPSKPIHPAYAAHYQQQFSVQPSLTPQFNFQQQHLNPQQHLNLQQQQHLNLQQQQKQQQQHLNSQQQQQQNFNQDLLKTNSQPTSTVQPQNHFPQYQQNQKQVNQNGLQIHNLNFPNGEIVPSIPQLEEHIGVPPQNNQQQQQKSATQQNVQTQYSQQINNQQNPQVQYNQQLQTQVQQSVKSQVQLQPSQSQYFQQNQQSFSSANPNQAHSSDISKQQLYKPQNNHQSSQHQKQTKQPVYTTPKPTQYQTKTSPVYSSTTSTPTQESVTEAAKDPQKEKESEEKKQKNLLALPDEVPADIREQLLSSGILANADIQILDYDKVGDIPIESLPPEALENFYGAGSAPVPAVVAPNSPPKPVEMKVVHYDPETKEGQKVEDSYIKDDATQVDSVVLNDSRYNRYLPLKVSGSNFPLPDVPQLKGRLVNSVVVLAPVDYDFVKQDEEDPERTGRAAPIQVQGVRFIAGDILKQLIKNPSSDNYKNWLDKEKSTSSDKQSVVLLVTSTTNVTSPEKEIFMYDIGSEKVSKLRGDLSSSFVEVAESNANSHDLDGLSSELHPQIADISGSASEIQPVRTLSPVYKPDKGTSFTDREEDLTMAASEPEVEFENNSVVSHEAPSISSGYSKMTAYSANQ